jgi:nicotinate-nucleotide adenylyltransferase
MAKLIGILGGTFDPVHIGHLRLGLEIREQFKLDEIRFIPLNIPPHRAAPVAGSEHRFNMLQAAIRDLDGFVVDDREINRDEVSWTIDTVRSLRSDYPHQPLCLLMGEDAFATLDSWRSWQELADYVHIILAGRPLEQPIEYSAPVRSFYDARVVPASDMPGKRTCGHICRAEMPVLNVSSTRLRQLYAGGRSTDFLVPPGVHEYIISHKLYT